MVDAILHRRASSPQVANLSGEECQADTGKRDAREQICKQLSQRLVLRRSRNRHSAILRWCREKGPHLRSIGAAEVSHLTTAKRRLVQQYLRLESDNSGRSRRAIIANCQEDCSRTEEGPDTARGGNRHPGITELDSKQSSLNLPACKIWTKNAQQFAINGAVE
jgi:hypothetical protein